MTRNQRLTILGLTLGAVTLAATFWIALWVATEVW